MATDVSTEHPRIAAVVAQLIDIPLVPVIGEIIEGHVWIDGRSFVNCIFRNAHFHSRTGHFGWRDNRIVGTARENFTFELPLAFAVNTRNVIDAHIAERGLEPG